LSEPVRIHRTAREESGVFRRGVLGRTCVRPPRRIQGVAGGGIPDLQRPIAGVGFDDEREPIPFGTESVPDFEEESGHVRRQTGMAGSARGHVHAAFKRTSFGAGADLSSNLQRCLHALFLQVKQRRFMD